MRGETGFHPPKPERPKEIGKYKLSPEFMAAMLAALVVVCPACKKTEEEAAIVPGNATVERREKREKPGAVYEILKQEVDPHWRPVFDKILEKESLQHYKNKFGAKEDKDNKFYINAIAREFKSLQNTKIREEIYALIAEYCEKEGVPLSLGYAVMANESAGRSSAVSSAGARGIFQVMPDTAKAMGISEEELSTRRGQIKAGIKRLKGNYKKYGQWGLALSAYNEGSGNFANLLIDEGHLDKDNFYKYVTTHFGGSQREFYTERPNLASLYTKRPKRPALGYPFRVIAMSRILDAIKWGDINEPPEITKERLWRPELWVSRVVTKTEEGRKKAVHKKHKKADLRFSQVDTDRAWTRRR